MSKARQLADNGAATPNRNMVINGAMNVAQRSTSVTGIGTTVAYNTVDRWRFADASDPPARFTETQSTDAPDGFGFSRKFEVTTVDSSVADDDMQYTDHFIEAQNLQRLKFGTSNAESLTFSFYVKCSVASTMGVRFTHEDGGGEYGASYTINSTNTWERKSITVPGNTATAINNDTGRGLRIAFGFTVGSDNAGTNSTAWGNGKIFGTHTNTFVGTSSATWQVTGVQLEVGSSATPFEHKTFAEDLQECQRYLYKWIVDSGAAYNFYATGFAFSTTQMSTVGSQGVPMRAASTFTTSGNFRVCSGSSCVAVTGLALGQGNRVTPTVEATIGSTAFTLSEAWGLGDNNDTDAYLQFDAEL